MADRPGSCGQQVCAPRPTGWSGEDGCPRGPSQGGSLGDVPSSPPRADSRGEGGRRGTQRGRSGPGTLRLPPRPGTSDRAPSSPGGAALTAGSCRSCAGCSARAACARTAWLQLRVRRAPRVAAKQPRAQPTSPSLLEAALESGTGPAHLWTAWGRGHGRPHPLGPRGGAGAS